MNDLQFLLVLASGIVIGALLPQWAQRLALIVRRYRYRPRLVRRHRPRSSQSENSRHV